jgi:integrase
LGKVGLRWCGDTPLPTESEDLNGNGLMVALLALCPIRRKNFVALELGRSFIQIHGTWWIVLSATETKENRPDERPIDELLTPVIDRYLSRYRPVLARTVTRLQPRAFLNRRRAHELRPGRRCDQNDHPRDRRVDVSPHLFRTAAASTVATRGGENPFLASALLHHSHPSVANAHYNRATSLSAADRLRQIVRQYEKK